MGTPEQIETMQGWIVAGVRPSGSLVDTRIVIGTRADADHAASQLMWCSIAGPFPYSIAIKS